MGKASRRKHLATRDDAAPDRKRISQASRRLGLIDSRAPFDAWRAQAAKALGDDDVEEWERYHTLDADDRYEFTYSSLERALVYSVGWRSWPLEVECAWMLPRLRDALTRASPVSQFVVEIGAGPGAAAAILSAALRVPVLAIDPHPLTSGMPERLAQMTGGSVVSHVAPAEELAATLDGRVPAAVYGMGVFRHFQQHHHQAVLSYATHMDAIMAAANADPLSLSFYEAIQGADLIISEMACPDYVAEVAAGAAPFGYQIPAGGVAQLKGATPDGPSATTGMHFSIGSLSPLEHHLLVESYLPLPTPRPGLEIADSPAAEALRWSLPGIESVDLVEARYVKGTRVVRREMFHYGDLAGQYTSDNGGYRAIVFVDQSEYDVVLDFVMSQERALVETGDIEVARIPASPYAW